MSQISRFVSFIYQNIQTSNSCHPNSEQLLNFHLAKPLPMRLESYIDHFLYQLDLEESLLASTYIIIEHFSGHICLHNIHRLVFTALSISYKAFTDKPVRNSTLETIGVLKPGELHVLEKIVLDWIEWDLEYSRIDEACKKLEGEKIQEVQEEDFERIQDDETDFTECGENDSFSELAAFF